MAAPKIAIGKLLGPVHAAKLVEIWNRQADAGTASYDNVLREFRKYLEPFAAELESRGVNATYAAYAAPYYICKKLGLPVPRHVEQIFSQVEQGTSVDDMKITAPGVDAEANRRVPKPPDSMWN